MPVRAFLDSDMGRGRRTGRTGTVSMPVRAFLDSDRHLCQIPLAESGCVSMPVRAFLDSDVLVVVRVMTNIICFNARQGIS